MSNLFEVPWYIRYPGQAVAALAGVAMNQFASSLPPWAEPIAILAGGALTLWVVVAFAWHVVNVVREKNGRPGLKLDSTHIIALGFLIVAAGFVWQAFGPAASKVPADLGKKLDDLSEKFYEYLQPRKLTAEQKKAIVEFLLPRTPHGAITVYYDSRDDEASIYASELHSALREADWETGIISINDKLPDGNPIGRGLYIRTEIGSSNFKGGTDRATDLLSQAFRVANVKLAGSGSSGNQQTAKNPENVTYLIVGRRPLLLSETMDAYKKYR